MNSIKLLFIIFLLGINIAQAKTEDGTSVAQPVSAYGTTSGGAIVPLLVASDGTITTNSGWTKTGTNVYTTISTNNVGIGTSIPARKFEVAASDSGTTLTTAAGATVSCDNLDSSTINNFCDHSFMTVDANGAQATTSKISGITTDHTAAAMSGNMAFITRNAGTLSEKMRLVNTGNLGIGTADPQALLQINTLGNSSTVANLINGSYNIVSTSSNQSGMEIDSSARIPSNTSNLIAGIVGSVNNNNSSVVNYTGTIGLVGILGIARMGGGGGTVTGAANFASQEGTWSGSGTATNQYGYYTADLTHGTNIYGFFSNVSSGSGKYAFYGNGTADNYFGGNVGIGSFTPRDNLDIVNANKTRHAAYFETNSVTAGSGSPNAGLYANNTSTQTGTLGSSGNAGVFASSGGSTTAGVNAGIYSQGFLNTLNFGVVGSSVTTKNSGYNIGVYGQGLNAGTSANAMGGYFELSSAQADSTATKFRTTAALIADNGSQAAPIFVARDNATEVFRIADGGNVGIGTNAPILAVLHVEASGVPMIRWGNTDYDGASIGSSVSMAFPGATSGDTYARIQVQNGGGSTTGVLALNSVGGNVGIGTFIPSSPLTIKGTAITQKVNGANTACNTTCGVLACFAGFDTAVTSVFVDCSDATADTCLCSK